MSKYVIFCYILIIHNKVSDINIEVSLFQRIYQCMNQKDMHIYKKDIILGVRGYVLSKKME